MDETFYDILSGKPNKDPRWRATVKGLESAKQRMEQLASESPGDYFVFNAQTQEVVARLHYGSEPTKDVPEPQGVA